MITHQHFQEVPELHHIYSMLLFLSTGSVSLTVSEGDPPSGVLHTFQAIDNDGPSDGDLQYTLSTPVSTHAHK